MFKNSDIVKYIEQAVNDYIREEYIHKGLTINHDNLNKIYNYISEQFMQMYRFNDEKYNSIYDCSILEKKKLISIMN